MNIDEKINSPVGNLLWVNVTGDGKKNYNDDGRDFVASVVLSAEDAVPLIEAINRVYDSGHLAASMKMKSMGYCACDENGKVEDRGSLDGDFYIFNFKTKTLYKNGTHKKITIYNALGVEVEAPDSIGNGSEGSIRGAIAYYKKNKDDGVTLWLRALQLKTHVPYKEDAEFVPLEGGTFTGAEEGSFKGEPANNSVGDPVSNQTNKPNWKDDDEIPF